MARVDDEKLAEWKAKLEKAEALVKALGPRGPEDDEFIESLKDLSVMQYDMELHRTRLCADDFITW